MTTADSPARGSTALDRTGYPQESLHPPSPSPPPRGWEGRRVLYNSAVAIPVGTPFGVGTSKCDMEGGILSVMIPAGVSLQPAAYQCSDLHLLCRYMLCQECNTFSTGLDGVILPPHEDEARNGGRGIASSLASSCLCRTGAGETVCVRRQGNLHHS